MTEPDLTPDQIVFYQKKSEELAVKLGHILSKKLDGKSIKYSFSVGSNAIAIILAAHVDCALKESSLKKNKLIDEIAKHAKDLVKRANFVFNH